MKIFVDIPENKECMYLKAWFKKHESCRLGILQNSGSLMVKCQNYKHKDCLNMSVKEWKRLGVRFIVKNPEDVNQLPLIKSVDNKKEGGTNETHKRP